MEKKAITRHRRPEKIKKSLPNRWMSTGANVVGRWFLGDVGGIIECGLLLPVVNCSRHAFCLIDMIFDISVPFTN